MPNHYAYERAMLRYMLTTRADDGLPVVWAQTLLRELADDLSAASSIFRHHPDEIAECAMDDDPEAGFTAEPLLLCGRVEAAYRAMTGAHPWGYHPEWLRVPASPKLGHARFPAWDRHGRKVV